jgi:peptidyl-prolyl cis-trans isomerase B (cyclophilin B)
MMKFIKASSFLVLAFLYSPVTIAQTIIEMNTSKGVMQIELYPDKAPRTVANFIKYIETGYFNNLVFHRVIKDRIIQSGGYDQNFMVMDTFEPVRNEATNGLENLRGTIAMARFSDPHSADSQFFINLRDNPDYNHRARTMSDYGYTVFGKVIKGIEVADVIGDVATHEINGFEDVPVDPILIRSVKLINDVN